MTVGYPFYSINEAQKPPAHRVYHSSECGPSKEIPEDERRPGTNSYRHCVDCERREKADRIKQVMEHQGRKAR